MAVFFLLIVHYLQSVSEAEVIKLIHWIYLIYICVQWRPDLTNPF